MKVVAKIEQGKVNIAVHSTEQGEDVKREMQFPFEKIGDGIKLFRMTDEALQDLVTFINKVEDN